jgi:hypothetical protein
MLASCRDRHWLACSRAGGRNGKQCRCRYHHPPQTTLDNTVDPTDSNFKSLMGSPFQLFPPVAHPSLRPALRAWWNAPALKRRSASRCIPICSGIQPDTPWPTRGPTPGRCRRTSAIARSKARSGTPRSRPAASKTSGEKPNGRHGWLRIAAVHICRRRWRYVASRCIARHGRTPTHRSVRYASNCHVSTDFPLGACVAAGLPYRIHPGGPR